MIRFLLVALVTWRVTSLFVREDGPFDVFTKLREKIGVYYNELEYPIPQGKNFVAKAMTCVWCFSLWVSPFMALLVNPSDIIDWFVKALALSTATIFLDEVLDRIVART